MTARRLLHLTAVGLICLVVMVVTSARAAQIDVPEAGLAVLEIPISSNALKPAECAHMNLSEVIVGNGKINGPSGNALILGGPGPDDIRGGNGDDCIVGGGGNDRLRGQNGDDVLLGEAGDDDLNGGPGYDMGYGGPGNDTFSACEVTIQ